MAELAHFESGCPRTTARVYQTKTASWNSTERQLFALSEAMKMVRKQRSANGAFEIASLKASVVPEAAGDEEEDATCDVVGGLVEPEQGER